MSSCWLSKLQKAFRILLLSSNRLPLLPGLILSTQMITATWVFPQVKTGVQKAQISEAHLERPLSNRTLRCEFTPFGESDAIRGAGLGPV